MVVIGALVRMETASGDGVRRRLAAIPGVTPFSVEDPARIGLIIEAESLDRAYRLLHDEIPEIEGVLGAWPVYVHFGEEMTSSAKCPRVPPESP
jgi:nitrate reductase NapAB chaperone NapD